MTDDLATIIADATHSGRGRLDSSEWEDEDRQAFQARADAIRDDLRDALEGMARQFGYWSDTAGGLWTGGLSALEHAFDVLGWDDPQPMPDMRCDEPGCLYRADMGWPTRPGGTSVNGGYRRTCHTHWCVANPGQCRSHPVPDGAT